MSNHKCHALMCDKHVPPRMLMCAKHWRMVPQLLQIRIWATYTPGQEITKTPTGEYMQAQTDAIDAVAQKEGISKGARMCIIHKIEHVCVFTHRLDTAEAKDRRIEEWA